MTNNSSILGQGDNTVTVNVPVTHLDALTGIAQRLDARIANIETANAACAAEMERTGDCGCTYKDCYDHGLSHNCTHLVDVFKAIRGDFAGDRQV